jgi:hypothetical protein
MLASPAPNQNSTSRKDFGTCFESRFFKEVTP